MQRARRKYPKPRRRRAKKSTLQPLTPEAHAGALLAGVIARVHNERLRLQWAIEASEYRAACRAKGEAKMTQRRNLPKNCAAEITRRNPA